MTRPNKITIGRRRSSDIVLSDPTISRRHAELVVTVEGRYFLADCGSKFGTRVCRGGEWRNVRQVFVDDHDVVRLGDYQTSVGNLIALALPAQRAAPPEPSLDEDNLAHARSTQIVKRGPAPRSRQTG